MLALSALVRSRNAFSYQLILCHALELSAFLKITLWYVVATLFHINWFYATHWNFRHFSKLQRTHIACYCCTTNKNAPPRLVEISSYDGATILLWSCLSLTVSGRLLARETDRWACMKAECTTCVELEWYIWPRRYANVIVFG